MLDETPKQPDSGTYARLLGLGARALVGYILAVAAGALIFAVIGDFVLPGIGNSLSTSVTDWIARTIDNAIVFFTLGAVFAIPYTIAGVAAWYYLLPRNRAGFLALGAFCPAAAILTLGIVMDGTLWLSPELVRMIVVTIPSGLAAAYIFGAIAMGHGFGRWRLG